MILTLSYCLTKPFLVKEHKFAHSFSLKITVTQNKQNKQAK